MRQAKKHPCRRIGLLDKHHKKDVAKVFTGIIL